jgi:alpha-D-xyloside xylohydrolase
VKFSHGAWLWADGVTPQCVKRINEHRIEGTTLIASGVDRTGNDGVDRFEGLVLELRISSPMPDVIRVQVKHHQRRKPGNSVFDLDYGLSADSVQIENAADTLLLTSGSLSLRLRKGPPWELGFESQGKTITSGGSDSLGHMRVTGKGDFLMQRLSLAVGECIYGLGERFGPLVKNGQSVSIWNEDGGTVSDLAYKNIPFYLSSRGYGFLVNSPGRVDFEIATERVSQIQFSVKQEELDYYFFHGPALKSVLDKYTRLSGRPAMPPAWSFGLWLSTSFTTQYNEETVNQFVDGMAQRQIPLRVFHFDCFWMKERHWCNFKWDTDAFPDPKGMLARLKAKGLKTCLWINPYISQLSELFDEGSQNGYFLKRPDGSTFQRDAWQPGMALVDFTNPTAVDWYCAKLRALLEMGADCFKTDFGELIPEDVVYHDGSDPALMHNYYTYLYNKAVFDLLEDYHGKGNALLFARSATAGCQKFPVHWGGDCFATFESMAEDLRGGLSFCLSGAAFWSHDIGGFAGKADPALYKRWVAFGLLSTHSRLHGSESYRVPWIFDEESVEVMRRFVELKNRLLPYLFSAAKDANEFGWPVMRAMVLEFADDPACLYLDRQYMLGSSLLVAPVFRPDNVAEYYLPRGRWTHLLTGAVVEGGHWQKETIDFMTVPVFVRENSLLPLCNSQPRGEWTVKDPLTLQLFAVADGADLPLRVVPCDGGAPVHFKCNRKGNVITLTSDTAEMNILVRLSDDRSVSKMSNGTAADGNAARWLDTRSPLVLTIK